MILPAKAREPTPLHYSQVILKPVNVHLHISVLRGEKKKKKATLTLISNLVGKKEEATLALI